MLRVSRRNPMAAKQTSVRHLLTGLLSFVIVAALLALFFAFRRHPGTLHGPHLSVSARQLPYYAFCSFYRMLAAYIIALIFSVIYGMAAAQSRARERVMIPAIDIAQSVPVVGFFPAAVYFFVALAHGSRLGIEMAAIFLIFTSQAWNMALGVFEAVRTIPVDSTEAFDSFGATGWLRFKLLLMPACVPKLVYNSILSWVSGWYYLIACEIITVGPAHYRLPGLGSFLMAAADKGRTGEILAGLATLLAVIVAMDVIVWQPLSSWAEKFRYESSAEMSESIRSLGMLHELSAIGPAITRAIRALFIPILSSVHRALRSTPPFNPAAYPAMRRVGRAMRLTATTALAVIVVYGIGRGMEALVRTLTEPWPPIVRQIPAATVASMLRMAAAYIISLAWTVPCAIAASESPRFARRLAPFAEIAGSMPATALFPLIVLFVIRVTGGMNLASILLILTGMQWYLLFNLLAGVSQIPGDLREAARSFGLSRLQTWRQLTLPAIVPSLLTGSITAWGGGWNALILSEYFVYRGDTYSVFGLGAMLDDATYQSGSGVMILLTLLSMVVVVVVLNRLVWRRLYDIAVERYRLD
jgi:NitT/TauT family transport system permease protein